ncbi:MAG: YcfL family protein [Vibrio sp.]
MKKWLFVALITSTLLGCASSKTGLEVNDGHQQVLFTDTLLAQQIAVHDLDVVTEDNQRFATLTVSNLTGLAQSIEYKLYWYDHQGLEMNIHDEKWHPLTLDVGQNVQLKQAATDLSVEDFRIQFRRMK